MKFGQVDNPAEIDFVIPKDDPNSIKLLNKNKPKDKPQIFIGCAKWNRQDLKNFYPRGTKDELAYYSTQFNSIEMNATFYRIFPREQVTTWKEKTPDGFKFFPKVPQLISHIKRLNEAEDLVEEYCDSIRCFEEKLGAVFLQMPDNFKPQHLERVIKFVEYWPKDIPLSVELRNTAWFSDESIAKEIYQLFETNGVMNILTDTAGRRDLMHMRLTSPNAFIRWVGANHSTDYQRLDDWFDRIKSWIDAGLNNLYFFVHQNLEQESPFLSAQLIKQINEKLDYNLTIPKAQSAQASLF